MECNSPNMRSPRRNFDELTNSPKSYRMFSRRPLKKRFIETASPRSISIFDLNKGTVNKVASPRYTGMSPRFVCGELKDTEIPSSPAFDQGSSSSYYDQAFDTVEFLGMGSFGIVTRTVSKVDGRQYAVKLLRDGYQGECDRQRKLREVQMLDNLPKHRNILSVENAWDENGYLFIQTELCVTSLANYLKLQKGYIPRLELWKFVIGTLKGLQHLHSNNMLHVDIKPDNILLTEDMVAKLADFSTITDVTKEKPVDMEDGDGKYMAPEVLNNGPSQLSDVYSWGLSFFEAATNFCIRKVDCKVGPYHHKRSDIITYGKKLSTDLKRVIFPALRHVPEERPSACQILADDAVARIEKELEYAHFPKLGEVVAVLSKKMEKEEGFPWKSALVTPKGPPPAPKKSRFSARLPYREEMMEIDQPFSDESDSGISGTSGSTSPKPLIFDTDDDLEAAETKRRCGCSPPFLPPKLNFEDGIF